MKHSWAYYKGWIGVAGILAAIGLLQLATVRGWVTLLWELATRVAPLLVLLVLLCVARSLQRIRDLIEDRIPPNSPTRTSPKDGFESAGRKTMNSESLGHRVAVLLRGPAGVGKSAVAEILLQTFRAPKDHFVNLDRCWAPGERRYNGGLARYQDLRKERDDLIVMELASGEVADGTRPGAPRGAQEWLNVLVEQNRRLYIFLLRAPWADVERRLLSRGECALLDKRRFYDAYAEKREEVVLRFDTPRPEIPIETSGRTPEQIAQDIAEMITGPT